MSETTAYGRDLNGPLYAVTDVPMKRGTAWQVWLITADRTSKVMLAVTDYEAIAVRVAQALAYVAALSALGGQDA